MKTWAFDWDTERQERLTRRGYIRHPEWFWYSRRRAVSDPVDLRPVESDVLGWVRCTNLMFGNTFESAYHRNFQLYSPSHNYDLHIIAEAPDGSFAAFAGLTGTPPTATQCLSRLVRIPITAAKDWHGR